MNFHPTFLGVVVWESAVDFLFPEAALAASVVFEAFERSSLQDITWKTYGRLENRSMFNEVKFAGT